MERSVVGDMTGAYLRVKRDGKFEPIEVEHLTGEERRGHLANRSMDEVMSWMDMVCETLSAIEKEHFIRIPSDE